MFILVKMDGHCIKLYKEIRIIRERIFYRFDEW